MVLSLETFEDVGQRDEPEVRVLVARAEGQALPFDFFLSNHAEIRNPHHARLANFGAQLVAAQIGCDPEAPLLKLLLSLQPKKLPPLTLLPKLQLRRNNDYGRHKSRSNER